MQHLQRHRDLFNFKCARCHRRFATDTELKEHEKKCRKRRYECYICRFTEFGMSFSKFRRHMAAHTGDKWIRCHGCTETFSTSVGLAHHVSVQHPQLNSTICQICCRRFTNKKDRDAHQMKCLKRRVECYICKRGSATIKKLNTHMSIKHSGAQKFQCKLCARKFQLKNNLRIHIKSHTKVGLVNCQYCNQRFSDIKYKKKHEFRCKQSFECYLCKKSFPAFAILYGVHMRTHLGKRPYHCKHCTKTFVSIRTYNLHVIGQHLHLYKFKCNICDGIIQKNKDVIAHRRSCMKPIRQSQNTIFFQVLFFQISGIIIFGWRDQCVWMSNLSIFFLNVSISSAPFVMKAYPEFLSSETTFWLASAKNTRKKFAKRTNRNQIVGSQSRFYFKFYSIKTDHHLIF